MERVRGSLFFVPVMGVLVSIVGAAVTIWIDSRLDLRGGDVPLGVTSTVESARAVLTTVAGATISFAAIAFSISLLIIQQASSQFSPRVVHTLFRDPFNKRVMGLVMGTFTYCLVVLRSVRSFADVGGDAVIPNLSVALAVVLGIATIIAIVAFLNHSAHSMDVSQILDRVEHEATGHAHREWSVAESDTPAPAPIDVPDAPAHIVRFDRAGWVQQIDAGALLDCLPDGTTAWVHAYPGRYAIPGAPLCALSAVPEDIDVTERAIFDAISTGNTRTMQQDVSFGLRQMADVGLKALSPGVNDPTTAQDSIFHSAAVLAELLRRDPPPRDLDGDGERHVVLVEQPTHDDLVRLAFGEIRRAAASQPAVCIYLLEALHLLREGLDAAGLSNRTAVLVDEARLVVVGCAAADVLPADLDHVRRACTAGVSRPTRCSCPDRRRPLRGVAWWGVVAGCRGLRCHEEPTLASVGSDPNARWCTCGMRCRRERSCDGQRGPREDGDSRRGRHRRDVPCGRHVTGDGAGTVCVDLHADASFRA